MLSNLNSQQKEAVITGNGPVLVIAGAGSGKTRVLTYRVAYLINNGVNPYNILAITFTNKAADEMKGRINLLADNPAGIVMSTFHSLCARILRADIDKLGYDKKFSIYSDTESERVIKKIVKALDDNNYKIDVKSIQNEISKAKEKAVTPEKYRHDNPGNELYADIYQRYEEELFSANALDFDDLLLKTVELFVKFPDTLYKYQLRFKHVLIDEFQDINGIQYTLIRLLADLNRNVFAVGDEDQSIYGWRGADKGIIKEFSRDFPDVKIYKLEQNYRSTGNILSCANKLIDHNPDRIKKVLWTDKGDGDDVVYKRVYSDREEAEFVINNIAALLRTGKGFKDIAVLVRANSLTRLFEEGFNIYGFPYRVYGGYKFYERKEIKDVIAYLRVLSNPKDNEAILRIINFPKRGIGDKAIEALVKAAEERPLIDAILRITELNIAPLVTNKIVEFRNLITGLINASVRMRIDELIDYVLEQTGILELYDKKNTEDRARLDNIQELVSGIKQYAITNENATVTDYLMTLALISDTDELGNGEHITIATVHSAKGLEFPVVFVVGLDEGIFPSSLSMVNPDDIEEERRVMYVAVTRAIEKLYITSSETRFKYNELKAYVPSRFINEMGLTKEYDNRPVLRGGFIKKPAYVRESSVMTAREKVDLTLFKNGVKVLHNRFGEGMIIEMKGENIAAIAFKGLGIREFNLEIAPIKVIGE